MMNENTFSASFNHCEIAAGITQSEKGNYLDFVVHRPEGMKGYMLQLTTFGKGIMHDGKHPLPLQRGQLLLFCPHSVHHYFRQPECPFWHSKWLYFYAKPGWLKWLHWRNTQQNIGRITLNDAVLFQEISQLFTKIEWELKSAHPFKQDTSRCLLEYLLMKCVSAEQSDTISPIDSRILKVCDLISANLSQNWNVAFLAQQVYLSESRLAHLFKQALGMGIIQWREQQRINEAQKLLYFSNLSVHKIAKSLGYEDALYFSKIFKKHTALSPSEFRRQEQNRL
ncbi:arabinose operon transcriptional regulator AraC [Muribacter muris]|nr:arabinose operon transcriptional regulator AraC [Muribacter muris]